MRTAILASLALLLAACETQPVVDDNQARVRNAPPPSCTDADFAECPEVEIVPCADGREPVIDYSSDCCPHFSCQPECVAAAPCDVGPAPICPPGTSLWIGTAIEDCCPAYRCEPDVTCDAADPVVCPDVYPYCADGSVPVWVGQTEDCCPIYQCPCELRPDGSTDPSCGCTYPTCLPGEQLQCLGMDVCGYPCECVPFVGECTTDAECGEGFMCDLSYCLPSPDCTDPSMPCTDVCYGMCVREVEGGCRGDLECPEGQVCQMECMGWACVPSPDFPCTCPPDDPACVCYDDGSCSSESCWGYCVPGGGTCTEPLPPEACPPPLMPCDAPVEVGVDPWSCCPMYECPECVPSSEVPCAMPGCEGAMPIGRDEFCCPIWCCPDASGACLDTDPT